jgi:hypothetical protein
MILICEYDKDDFMIHQLICTVTGASAGILLASHGMSMDDWRIRNDNAQPHVYISVFEMMMNFLILFALAEGVVVRFWRQLLHGTTVRLSLWSPLHFRNLQAMLTTAALFDA